MKKKKKKKSTNNERYTRINYKYLNFVNFFPLSNVQTIQKLFHWFSIRAAAACCYFFFFTLNIFSLIQTDDTCHVYTKCVTVLYYFYYFSFFLNNLYMYILYCGSVTEDKVAHKYTKSFKGISNYLYKSCCCCVFISIVCVCTTQTSYHMANICVSAYLIRNKITLNSFLVE